MKPSGIYVAALFLCSLTCRVAAQDRSDTLRRPVYDALEHMAEFPGGVIQMEKYVLQHLHLPASLNAAGISGVYTRFIVRADGTVSDVKVVRSSGYAALDDSVKAVIMRMPAWKPGMLNGRAVSSYYNLPISCFKLK